MIMDRDTFLSLSSQCEKVVDPKKRLPSFVFRQPFAFFYSIEYVHIYREEFGKFLSKVAGDCGDRTVNYMTLDPNPAEYYRQSGFYGLVSFDPCNVGETYVAAMHPIRSVSKILAGANVGVFWGSSLKWAIMADRVSWEMAVIGAMDGIDVSKITDFRCMDPSSLSDYVKAQYHAKDPSDSIAIDFTRTFLANYPCHGWQGNPRGSSPRISE